MKSERANVTQLTGGSKGEPSLSSAFLNTAKRFSEVKSKISVKEGFACWPRIRSKSLPSCGVKSFLMGCGPESPRLWKCAGWSATLNSQARRWACGFSPKLPLVADYVGLRSKNHMAAIRDRATKSYQRWLAGSAFIAGRSSISAGLAKHR